MCRPKLRALASQRDPRAGPIPANSCDCKETERSSHESVKVVGVTLANHPRLWFDNVTAEPDSPDRPTRSSPFRSHQ